MGKTPCQSINRISSWLNSIVEISVRNKTWYQPTPESINAARMIIINNPAEAIYSIIRSRAEIMLGVREMEDVFPDYICKAVSIYFRTRMRSGRPMRELIRNYCEAEYHTPAVFPKMLAKFAAVWLSRKDRWRTMKFKKFQRWLSYQNADNTNV